MPNIREEIGKTFRKFGWGDRTVGASLAETVLATDPREGQDYGSYRILRRLGFGGMGHVYLALDTRLGRYVALKFLDARLTTDPAMLARLHQEARTASSLNHPNILTIYEIGEANNEHFIASEYVDGITLRAALDRKLITPEAAIEIASQIASALVAAHSAGIIHRDLKPSNLMIRHDGLVKIIDFGLAKVEGRTAPLDAGSAGPAFAGTVQYMSPEQTRGDRVDARTDLWSLGVVLYEMLAGECPFDGATESHIIVSILDQPVPPIAPDKDLPAGVTEVIDRALTKERNKRYQRAAEMLGELAALGVNKQGSSTFPGLKQRRKSPIGLIIGITIPSLIAALAGWWWFGLDGREHILGPKWFQPGPPEQVTFNGHVRLATISPDGNVLAYSSREGAREILHLRNLETKQEFTLAPIEDRYLGLSFSPDSQFVFFMQKDRREWGRLFSIGIHGGLPRLLVDDVDGPVTFAPDGKQFAFMRRSESARSAVFKIIVTRANDTGEQRVLAQKIDSFISMRLAWSPDGKKIAAVVPRNELRNSARPHLYFYPVNGEEPADVFSDSRFSDIDSQVWLDGRRLMAFTAVSRSLTADRTHLYQFSTVTRQYQQMIDDWIIPRAVSATADGQILAAVRKRQSASIWLAAGGATEKPERIPLTGDLSDPDSFTWLNSAELVVSASNSQIVGLWRVGLNGHSQRLTPANDCLEAAPAALPDGQHVAYFSNCAASGNDYNIWVRNLRTGQAKRLTSGSNTDMAPAISPDGKWIVYSSSPSGLTTAWKMPTDGGATEQLSTIQADNPAFAPDGRRIICLVREFYDGPTRPAILSMATGKVLRDFPNLRAKTPIRWSPTGESIDYVSADRMQILRLPLAGGPARVLATSPDQGAIWDFSWDKGGNRLALLTSHEESNAILVRNATK